MKLKMRGLTSVGLIFLWSFSALSGFVLSLAPEGQRSGRISLFLDLTKNQWSDLHTWVSFLALGVTILHIILVWNVLLNIVKLSISAKATEG